MNQKWITTLLNIVMVGIVFITAAACEQPARTSTPAKLLTPTPGDRVTGTVQPGVTPTSRIIAVNIELDIFSGLPNPTWMLTLPDTSDLVNTISRLNPSPVARQRPDNLGYRGFIIQITRSPSAIVQTIRAYHGIIEVVDSNQSTYYLDPQRQIELLLLATANPPLADNLRDDIVKEIIKDLPQFP